MEFSLRNDSLAVGMMRSLKLMEEGKKRERKLRSLNVCRVFFQIANILLIFCSTACGNNIFARSCRHTQSAILGHL